ncbi:MAG: cytochrome C oxidase subunit IV family protein [Myxococcaceae bacterium]
MAEHAKVSRKSYWVVFVILAVLTALEVAVAHPSLGISRTTVGFTLVAMALSKAALVGWFYMHLNHEMKALKLTVVIPFFFPALYAVVLISEAGWRLLR